MAEENPKVEMIYDLLQEIRQELKTNHMPKSEIEERFRNQGERLGKVEQNLTWVIRTILGAIIITAMTLLYQGGK